MARNMLVSNKGFADLPSNLSPGNRLKMQLQLLMRTTLNPITAGIERIGHLTANFKRWPTQFAKVAWVFHASTFGKAQQQCKSPKSTAACYNCIDARNFARGTNHSTTQLDQTWSKSRKVFSCCSVTKIGCKTLYMSRCHTRRTARTGTATRLAGYMNLN